MRAAVLTEYNKPWQLKDVPDPKPGPGQVVVRIEACGLCGTDVHVHHGIMPFVTLPIVPGHEPVGRIVEVGAGVSDLRVGDRVGAGWVQKGCGRCAACQGSRFWQCARYRAVLQVGK
jgi:D-arabinose 1-dehydrogenase-like Zn-dependent alcohol dehydrogenase